MGRRRGLVPAVAAPLAGAGTAMWFYGSFVRRRSVPLGPGMWLVSGGGGNSLVVRRGDEILVVDTKFGPGAGSLRRWVDSELGGPVTEIVNTHFHYDHTQGNALFPEAEIWAHEAVPRLMDARDGAWWRTRQGGVPNHLVGDGGRVLSLAGTDVELHHPGPAHTDGDLYVHVPEARVVATGDLVFHGYYPFFDTGYGGASLLPLAAAVRRLAAEHPGATFVPGHGPPAAAGDLLRYARYLDELHAVARRVNDGRVGRRQGVRLLRRATADLSILPSFHDNRLRWATPARDLDWGCTLLGAGPADG